VLKIESKNKHQRFVWGMKRQKHLLPFLKNFYKGNNRKVYVKLYVCVRACTHISTWYGLERKRREVIL
jgi:hypothetical protein